MKRRFVVTISHFTVRLAKLFRRGKGEVTPTLQETAKDGLGGQGGNANAVGENPWGITFDQFQKFSVNLDAMKGLKIPESKVKELEKWAKSQRQFQAFNRVANSILGKSN